MRIAELVAKSGVPVRIAQAFPLPLNHDPGKQSDQKNKIGVGRFEIFRVYLLLSLWLLDKRLFIFTNDGRVYVLRTFRFVALDLESLGLYPHCVLHTT